MLIVFYAAHCLYVFRTGGILPVLWISTQWVPPWNCIYGFSTREQNGVGGAHWSI